MIRILQGDCRGCCARSIARSPQAFEARKAGVQTYAYRQIVAQIGALVVPPVTHEEVRQAAAADATLREKASA